MKRTMNIHWVAALAAAAVLALAGVSRAEGSKIAFLDIKRCVTETKMGKQYGDRFRAKREQIVSDVKAKEAELKKLKADYERQAAILSEAARKDKEAEFEQKKKQFQEFYENSEEEMKRSSDELTGAVLKDIEQIMRAVAKEKGYDVVLNTNGPWLLYAEPDADITDEVMRAYDAKAEGK